MNVNKKSISYQLFTFGDRNKLESNSNICTYTRGVLAGVMLWLFAVVVGTMFSIVLLEPIASILAYWVTGISFIPFFGYLGSEPWIIFALGSAIWIVVLALIIVFSIKTGYDNIKYKAEHSTNPNVQKSLSTLGVFGEYIQSKHDKFCRNISFTNGK